MRSTVTMKRVMLSVFACIVQVGVVNAQGSDSTSEGRLCAEPADRCEPGTIIRNSYSGILTVGTDKEKAQELESILAQAHVWASTHCNFDKAIIASEVVSSTNIGRQIAGVLTCVKAPNK